MLVWALCRWGNTPLDEGRMCGNKNLIKLLEAGKVAQLSEFPQCAQEITGITEKVNTIFLKINLIILYIKCIECLFSQKRECFDRQNCEFIIFTYESVKKM